jgi:hypothetical protein
MSDLPGKCSRIVHVFWEPPYLGFVFLMSSNDNKVFFISGAYNSEAL